jgi:drug/metabolite transporter (DMT)-like permease
MQKPGFLPILQVTFAVIAWGASFVATKIALRYLAPAALVWMRFSLGMLVLGAVVLARKQLRLPQRADVPYFLLLGFLGIAFHQWLQSNGLVSAQATTSAWIVATTPIFIALLAWLVLKEKLSLLQSAGIFLAVLGVLLVVSKGDFRALAQGRFGAAGDILVMISAVNWAVFSILSRRGLQQHPPAWMMFFVMAFGWVFLSALFAFNFNSREIASLPPDGWAAVLFLGFICSGFAYIFWYDALKVIPASEVGVFLYIEPLVTVIVAWALLNERLVWATILGGAIILTGIWMVNRPDQARRLGRILTQSKRIE